MLLALDPGISTKNATGVALFNPDIKRLVAADIIRRNPSLDGVDAQIDIAQRAVVWAVSHAPKSMITDFVSEWPRSYPDSNVDPNTALLPLCGIVSATAALLPCERHIYEPRQWKGTVDGTLFLGRIIDRLDEREKLILNSVMPPGLRHNATDAIGLALFRLGRLTRQRVAHIA
ncbi:MAG: hypothetical protein NVS3B25_09680 [Hymenobacter sp.]